MRMLRCVLLVAVCVIPSAADDTAKTGYVDCSVGDKHLLPPVFSNPCTSQPVGTLSCGEKVKVLAREGPWLRIASADGSERYIGVGSVSQKKDRFLALDLPSGPTRECDTFRPNLEILSDTLGVDFVPYLKLILPRVRENWHRLIPGSLGTKKGKLTIEFTIMKDGSLRGPKLVASSGDVTLDRPAYGSILASNPFPSLPSEFGGTQLTLRVRFYYNPDKAELE